MSLKGRRKRQRRKPGSHVDRYARLAEQARQAAASKKRQDPKTANVETTPTQSGETEPADIATD